VDALWTAHIVGMSNHIETTVRELDFVQGTSDKFYRLGESVPALRRAVNRRSR